MHRIHSKTLLVALGSWLLVGCTGSPAATRIEHQQTPAAQPTTDVPQPIGQQRDTVTILIEDVADRSAAMTRLPPDYIYARLLSRDDSQSISAAFDRLQISDVSSSRDALIDALELDFVHRPTTSSLDLLNPELSEHFREFDWHEDDYPGGPAGPNETLADILSDALDIVSPERRANRSRTAVLTRDEVTPEIMAFTLAQWTPVPGESDWKLNRHAVASYLLMRDAALADGVELKILSAHRDPQRAQQNAARAGNRFAVASFSSHSLGLAIDFALPQSQSNDTYKLTTRPMSQVVQMRCSPVHKWLHLHAHKFGWYPFQHEPWHWEFNPPGFRGVFFTDFPDAPPAPGQSPS